MADTPGTYFFQAISLKNVKPSFILAVIVYDSNESMKQISRRRIRI